MLQEWRRLIKTSKNSNFPPVLHFVLYLFSFLDHDNLSHETDFASGFKKQIYTKNSHDSLSLLMFAYLLAEEMAVVGNMIESRNHLLLCFLSTFLSLVWGRILVCDSKYLHIFISDGRD